MKTIIFYDTESTNLPLFKERSEHPDQPHVVQLAAELCVEETGKTLGAINLILKPEGWQLVPVESTAEMNKAAVIFVNGKDVYEKLAAGVLEIEESIYAEIYEAMLAAAPAPRSAS